MSPIPAHGTLARLACAASTAADYETNGLPMALAMDEPKVDSSGAVSAAEQLEALVEALKRTLSPDIHGSCGSAHAALVFVVGTLTRIQHLKSVLEGNYPDASLDAALPDFERDIIPICAETLAYPHPCLEDIYVVVTALVSEAARGDQYQRWMAKFARIYEGAKKVRETIDAFESQIKMCEEALERCRTFDNDNQIDNNNEEDEDEEEEDEEDDDVSIASDISTISTLKRSLPRDARYIIAKSLPKERTFIETEEASTWKLHVFNYYIHYAEFIKSTSSPLHVDAASGNPVGAIDKAIRDRWVIQILERCAYTLSDTTLIWDKLLTTMFSDATIIEHEETDKLIYDTLFNKAMPKCSKVTNALALTPLYQHVLNYNALYLVTKLQLNSSAEELFFELDKVFNHLLITILATFQELKDVDYTTSTTIEDVIAMEESHQVSGLFNDPTASNIKVAVFELLEKYANSIVLMYSKHHAEYNLSYQTVVDTILLAIVQRYYRVFGDINDFYRRPETILFDRVLVNNSILRRDFVRNKVFEHILSKQYMPEAQVQPLHFGDNWVAYSNYEFRFGEIKKVRGILRRATNSVVYNQQLLFKELSLSQVLPGASALEDYFNAQDLIQRKSDLTTKLQELTKPLNVARLEGATEEEMDIVDEEKNSKEQHVDEATLSKKRKLEERSQNIDEVDTKEEKKAKEEQFKVLDISTAGLCLYVANIPTNATIGELYEIFSKYGLLIDISVNNESMTDKYDAIVEYAAVKGVKSALNEKRQRPKKSFILKDETLELMRCKSEHSTWNFVSKKEDNKIFVNNLPAPSLQFMKSHLLELFKNYGEIKDIRLIPKYPNSGAKKANQPEISPTSSFAYIEFMTRDAAQKSLSLNNTVPKSLSSSTDPIKVSISDPESKGTKKPDIKENEKHSVERDNSNEIFMTNMPFNLSESEISKLIHKTLTHASVELKAGDIKNLRLLKDDRGASKGTCFVDFTENSFAAKAIELLNGKMIGGRKISVRVPEERSKSKKAEARKMKRQMRAEKRQSQLNNDKRDNSSKMDVIQDADNEKNDYTPEIKSEPIPVRPNPFLGTLTARSLALKKVSKPSK